MSPEKLVEILGAGISRRRFLKGAGASAIGALAALAGWPLVAEAACPSGTTPYKCCCVCKYPPNIQNYSTSCPAGYPKIWCWTCNYAPEQRDYRCCEHHTSGYCVDTCGGVTKSTVWRLQTAPEPA